MATKATELQPPAVRDVVRRVRRECFSPVGVGEVDQRRRQNFAVFPAIGVCLAWRSVTWRGYGVLHPGTFTCLALAQDNTTRRSQSDRMMTVAKSPLHSKSPGKSSGQDEGEEEGLLLASAPGYSSSELCESRGFTKYPRSRWTFSIIV
jgi:hypothetical protein